MSEAALKFENVHASELNPAGRIEINGGLKTVGSETVKIGFFGALVDGVKVKTVKRVLFPKWHKGLVTGYHSQI